VWKLATASVAGLIIAHEIAFYAVDTRLPRDLSQAHVVLAGLYRDLGSTGTWAEIVRTIAMDAGGWYNAILAISLRLLGRSPWVFEAWNIAWLALILGGMAMLLTRQGRPGAAMAGIALASSMPSILTGSRVGWIHMPEAALVLLVVRVWMGDPGLGRWRTVFALILLPSLALTLRPSAVIWIALTVPLVLSNGRFAANRQVFRRRLTLVGAGLVPALLHLGLQLGPYIMSKLQSRPRYLAQVSPLGPDLLSSFGVLILLICGIGTVLLLSDRESRRQGFVQLMLSWVAIAVLLKLLFGVGLDNFPVAGCALAILGAMGLARLGRWGPISAVLVAILLHALTWTPASFGRKTLGFLPFSNTAMFEEHPSNYLRAWSGLGSVEVKALLDATCPDRQFKPCHVEVDHGLFQAFSEDPGHLELFLMGEDQVMLHSVLDQPVPVPHHIDAMAIVSCAANQKNWQARYPNAITVAQSLVRSSRLSPAWTRNLGGGCRYDWLTPFGLFERPDLAPPQTWEATPAGPEQPAMKGR